jgi:hypothetical protein
MRKATRLLTNSAVIAESVSKRCDGTHDHQVIEGSAGGLSRAVHAQSYPNQLVDSILKAYLKQVGSERILLHTFCGHDDEIQKRIEDLYPVAEEVEPGDAADEEPSAEEPAQPEEGDDDGVPLAEGETHEQRRELKKTLRRAHQGLGHPDSARFLRILRAAGCEERVLAAARRFQCSTCQALARTHPWRRAAPPRDLQTNDIVGLDTIEVEYNGEKIRCMNAVDWASRFQMVIPLTGDGASAMRTAYGHWLRVFGPACKLYVDQGSEFMGIFKERAEEDGSILVYSSLESPTQRGVTERAGGAFKQMLAKALGDFQPQDKEEFLHLLDTVTMMKNRLQVQSGYSPVQRVLGYTPRLPGGVLSGDVENMHAHSKLLAGDVGQQRREAMRTAAGKAYFEADCSAALKRAIASGPRPQATFEVGQKVYYWKSGGTGGKRKFKGDCWRGPALIVATEFPTAVWLSHQRGIVKAAPEQVRHATEEELLGLSGFLDGLREARKHLTEGGQTAVTDITTEELPPPEGYREQDGDRMEEEAEPELRPDLPPQPPLSYRRGMKRDGDGRDVSAREEGEPSGASASANDVSAGENGASVAGGGVPPNPRQPDPDRWVINPTPLPPRPGSWAARRGRAGEDVSDSDEERRSRSRSPRGGGENASANSAGEDGMRGISDDDVPSEIGSDIDFCDHFNVMARLQAVEVQPSRLGTADQQRYQRSTVKEWNRNLEVGAYKLLSPEESSVVRERLPGRIMQSRWVHTRKPVEETDLEDVIANDELLDDRTSGLCKAKTRWVAKGFSDPDCLDVPSTTPQVHRDTVLVVLQALASRKWKIGFLDFTQAFMSGKPIERASGPLYCEQPKGGVPGADPQSLIQLLKTVYGLTDGPYAWFCNLDEELQKMGYRPSTLDPCLYLLYGPRGEVDGLVAVATDDILHGGVQTHQDRMESLRTKYKMGKFVFGEGTFLGKQIQQLPDFSITVDQKRYLEISLKSVELEPGRRRAKYSRCTKKEESDLRGAIGVLSWLAKETRPDLSGATALLQQQFPDPQVRHILEANKLVKEAAENVDVHLHIKPIPIERLGLGVFSDAGWGNASSVEDQDGATGTWVEQKDAWIFHHHGQQRVRLHPLSIPGGPDPQILSGDRIVVGRSCSGVEFSVQDDWTVHTKPPPELSEPWTGSTIFLKQEGRSKLPSGKVRDPETFLLFSQAGYLVFAFDKALTEKERQAPITVLSWKSFRLRRKAASTLSAETQALATSLSSLQWHRLLLLECLHGTKVDHDWERAVSRFPAVAIVDSKSVYDAVSKLSNTASQVEDKRTAIDLAIIKRDLKQSGIVARWVPTEAQMADSFTKRMSSEPLRQLLQVGELSIVSEERSLQAKLIERQQRPKPQFGEKRVLPV